MGEFIRIQDSVLERVTGTGTGGNVTLAFTAVPKGYYYRVVAINGYQATDALTRIVFQVNRGGTTYDIESISSPAGSKWHTCSREIFLKEDDVARVRFVGTTSGRSLEAHLNAEKFYYLP